jgi:Zn-dependent peptidase ImmA (M78 family)/predicted secreted protein
VDWFTAQRVGLLGASRALRELEIDRTRWIDVFSAIEREEIILAFRNMPRLAGAFLDQPNAQPGIIVNAAQPVHRQRYTAAHEYGHYRLQHSTAIDFDLDSRTRGAVPDHEKVADAFASWFLAPRDLARRCLTAVAPNRLLEPASLYQFSLRVGMSYEAATRHAQNLKLATGPQVSRLLLQSPSDIKQRFGLGGLGMIPREDVWLLTERDNGIALLVEASSWLVFDISEVPSSGFTWTLHLPDKFKVRADTNEDGYWPMFATEDRPHAQVGGAERRFVVVQVEDSAGEGDDLIVAELARPWETGGDAAGRFELPVNVRNPRLGVGEAQMKAVA